MSQKELLKVENLSVSFTGYERGFRQIDLQVIENLNVTVKKGEMVAVVGASGSGKSLLAHTLLGILPPNSTACGNIYFEGELLNAQKINQLRGKEIAFVPQSVTYLDPLKKVGSQVRKDKKGIESYWKQQELFSFYDLPAKTDNLYPFELSGGMARRVFLSAAMMETPKLIVADEPTPGLHLEAAKNSLKHFREFADKGGGVLLITHDIELALEVSDRIAVFYAGTTVEEAFASDFQSENLLRHPYTKALWRALPQNGFAPTPGVQPYVKDKPQGCVYAPRCSVYSSKCNSKIPMQTIRNGSVLCACAK